MENFFEKKGVDEEKEENGSNTNNQESLFDGYGEIAGDGTDEERMEKTAGVWLYKLVKMAVRRDNIPFGVAADSRTKNIV